MTWSRPVLLFMALVSIAYTCTHAYKHTCTYIHTHTHIHTYIYIHTHTNIHTYTYILTFSSTCHSLETGTTITIAIDSIENAHEFLLVDDFSANHGQWLKTNEFSSISEGKLIAPGNLRATQDNEGYKALFDYWVANQYQLRYTGGMVPDVNQILVKGKGVFVNVASPNTKSKLRMLYEVAPIGFIMEKAGGKSSDGEQSVLNIEITNTEQVSQVAFGSIGEVNRFEEFVGRKYME